MENADCTDKCYVPNAFIVSYDLETVINTEQSSHSGTFVQREPRGTVFRFFSRDDRAGEPSSPKVANERPSGHVLLAEHGEVDKRRSGWSERFRLFSKHLEEI